MNKIENKIQIEKAINKLPYSLGKLASEMLDAYLADDREKYIALANQFDGENAEKAAEDVEIQRALKHAKEFASLIIPYIQPWLTPKLPLKNTEQAQPEVKNEVKQPIKTKAKK